MIGLIARTAALAPTLTLLTHRLLIDAGRPGRIDPFGIGPIDHVGPLEFAGLRDLGAFALILLTLGVLYQLLPLAVGGRKRVSRTTYLAFGLFLGGALSNTIEVLLRGAAMDWLWISVDPATATVINWADLAIAAGGTLLIVSLLWPVRAERGAA